MRRALRGPYALRMGRRVLGVVITVIAVAFCLLSSFYVFGATGYRTVDDPLNPTWLSSGSFIVAIGAAVLLVWRHRWPELVTGVALAPALLMTSDAAAALIALAALAYARRGLVLWGGAVLVYAATALAVWRDAGWHPRVSLAGEVMATTMPGKLIGVLVTALVLTAVPMTVGIVRRTRAELRARESNERALRDEVTRQEERSRIAHEMHDVLGHRLSLLSLQAGALEVTREPAPDVARTVRTTARKSLEDLRQVIGVLRDGRDFHLSPGSVQSLADLPALVASTREAGVPVNLTVMLEQIVAAPAQLGMAIYRLVQESLTNVLRHAPGMGADVNVHGGPGHGVTVEVVNRLVAAPPPSPGSGTGLTGMAERVAALGGTITTGPTPQGTFVVRAWLPWHLTPVG